MPHATLARAALAALALAAALSSPALAAGASIYKCGSAGSAVYQDHPCNSAREGTLQAGNADIDLLFARSQAVEQELTAMQQAYKAQMQALQTKRRRAADVAAVDAEIATVERNWQQRLAATRARHQTAQAALRAQCPRGASVEEGRTTCLR